MRIIDADRLKVVLEKNYGHTGGAAVLAQLIDAQQTIQPERKKGRWTVTSLFIKCSECGEAFMLMPQNYYPNCGADMRGEEDE